MQSKQIKVVKSIYGNTKDGSPVYAFHIENGNQITIEIIEFGAILTRVKTPDKMGLIDDITLGYDELEQWENDPYYFGANIGRVANRTGGAKFTLEGQVYDLVPNTLPDFGKNHLHGGATPFNKVVWKGQEFQNEEAAGVTMRYTSVDGEEGYPGNLLCEVTYSLNKKNELKIEYKAETDQTTIVNMTHHSYFNLDGAGNGSILDHQIQINADKYTVADDDLIPTGTIAEVEGLPIDFSENITIGSRMSQMQEKKFTGYDLNYVLNHSEKGALEYAGKAVSPQSGRVLEVFTTQPCMHFYTSNFLEGKEGRKGEHYAQYAAFCFEPQGYPDAANKPAFESILLNPSEEYHQTIIYRFSTQE
ncbi:UNVERIFIED_CONTAM: hypothetical protein GTU68_007679 [Idotea baltica]|nr:hypothetical protein [Idotea baltica]